ncbi:MAG: adenosylmethionine decarboxylase [Nitratireductor sp.]
MERKDASDSTLSGFPFLIVGENGAYAGMHVLIDFYGARCLNNSDVMHKALLESAEAAGATVLNVYVHTFGSGGGVTGLALLAESHISVHSWPEYGFAAFDVFMCGKARPNDALPVLLEAFRPRTYMVQEVRRGDCVTRTAESTWSLRHNQKEGR